MALLEELFPVLRRTRQIPLSRDQAMLLLMAVNLVFLGIDTFLAHSTSGTVHSFEWIPIIFGPSGGVILVICGLIALRKRQVAAEIASLVFLASLMVGILGTYFHLRWALLPAAPTGEQITLALFVWTPPSLGPMAFCLVGLMGLSAVWEEQPVDSGVLLLPFRLKLNLPYRKTQAYYLMVGLGVLISLISSTLDHARTGFTSPWFLIPLVAGVFGAVIPIIIGFTELPSRQDILTFAITMGLLVLVGVVGSYLHIQADLAGKLTIIPERFLRGAPLLAPMLYANFGLLGIIALIDPSKQ